MIPFQVDVEKTIQDTMNTVPDVQIEEAELEYPIPLTEITYQNFIYLVLRKLFNRESKEA